MLIKPIVLRRCRCCRHGSSLLNGYNELVIDFPLFSILGEVEDSIDHGITTPSPMLSALPDSPSPTAFNESSALSQSIWSEEIEYVELEKEDRGLGFSILDYKVRGNTVFEHLLIERFSIEC